MSEKAGPTNPTKQSESAPSSNRGPRVSELATASLWMSLVMLCAPFVVFPVTFFFGVFPPGTVLILAPILWLFAIAAAICGIAALIAIRRANGALTGKGRAIKGLILGCTALVLLPPLSFAATFKSRESAKNANCQNNLKQLGLVFKLYAGEHKDRFPNLSPIPGNLMCDRSIYPDYLSNLSCFRHKKLGWFDDPLTPETAFTDRDYFYLGYCMTNDTEVAAFVEAYRQACNVPGAFDGDLKVVPGKGNAGSDTLYHLREGIERFFVTDMTNPAAAAIIASKIPVIVERPSNHISIDIDKSRSTGTWKREPGSHVLYLDGHVEFVAHPGRFPMTEATMAALESVSPRKTQ